MELWRALGKLQFEVRKTDKVQGKLLQDEVHTSRVDVQGTKFDEEVEISPRQAEYRVDLEGKTE